MIAYRFYMSTLSKEKNSPTYLRIPPDLKQKLEDEATKNQRSLTGEITYRLRQSFPARLTVGGAPTDG